MTCQHWASSPQLWAHWLIGPSDGQVGSDLKVMMAACHSMPDVEPSEPLPSKGGQPDSAGGGSSPKVAPACIHWAGVAPIPSPRTRVPSPMSGERWTQEKAPGVGMETSPLLFHWGRGVWWGVAGSKRSKVVVSAATARGAEIRANGTTCRLECAKGD